MKNELLFFGIYFLDIICITYLARIGWKAVGFSILINMILITTIGQKLVDVFGLVSNVGVIFYSAVFFGMSICASRNTFKGVMRLVHATFIAMVMFTVLVKLSLYLDLVPGNEEVVYHIKEALISSGHVAVASFLAYYSSNIVNILLVQRGHKIIGNISGQLVDSLLFFPVAFYGIWSSSMIVTGMMSGFILKAILNTIDTPFWYHCKKYSYLSCQI